MPYILTNSGSIFLSPMFLSHIFLLLFIFLNVDNDGVPDYLDLDSDDDKIPDLLEYGSRVSAHDVLGEVYKGGSPDDSDCCSAGYIINGVHYGETNTWRLAREGSPCRGGSQQSNAMCGHYDFRDADADGDGISDTEECGADIVGRSFTAHNFDGSQWNRKNEILIVVVDGGAPQIVNINFNCDTAVNCATGLDPLINGASVTAVDGNLVITSANPSGNVVLPLEINLDNTQRISGGSVMTLFNTVAAVAARANANCRDTDGK